MILGRGWHFFLLYIIIINYLKFINVKLIFATKNKFLKLYFFTEI